MNTGSRIACSVLILLAAAGTTWALEPVGPASEAVLQGFRDQTGREPTAEDLVGILNRATVGLLQAGQYAQAEPFAHEALALAERDLGREHPVTLAVLSNLAMSYEELGRYDEAEKLYLRTLEVSERILGKDDPDTLITVNNLAYLYQAQGRYGEAEPLYLRAVEAKERVLDKDHPDTLTVQFSLAAVFIDRGQRDQAVRELRHIDKRLRGFVGNQLDTTHRERVRRRWLLTKSNFQHAVFSLALQHPDPDTLGLAADVLLRWKRLAGEAEALTARLVRTSRDPQVVKLTKELSERRAELSRLVNLPTPDEEAAINACKNAIANARAEVERLEVGLADLSRRYRDHRVSRAADWEQIRSELPQSSALLSLRAFVPVDLATGDAGEPHWLILLIPADPGDGPELLLRNLGPIVPTAQAQRALRKTYSKGTAGKLYQRLFGQLDAELTKYRLYIAADGMLDLVAFARLVVPDGRYWIERQELRQIRTGRDLVPQSQQTPGRSKAEGMLVLGGVDYTHFPAPGKKSPPPVATQEKTTDQLLAMTRRPCDERGGFTDLKLTGSEAQMVGLLYGFGGRKAKVWRGQKASESRLKTWLESLAPPHGYCTWLPTASFAKGNRSAPSGP